MYHIFSLSCRNQHYSPMASVLHKDILHVVGDNGDDSNVGSGGRTEGPSRYGKDGTSEDA